MGDRFQQFDERYRTRFRRRTRCGASRAWQYLRGLMQARRKNMERMEEVVPECDYQSLQHFLSHSEWDARGVLDQVAWEADGHLGGTEESCLLLDESAFAKKGKKSVGVARQWSGRQGKVDNCQVAVFAALARGPYSTLIDTRLYLPKEWVADPKRCLSAGVPKSQIVQKSKSELALEMVRQARQNGVRFSWVGTDGGYGKEPSFLRQLEEQGEIFVSDVHKDQHIYLEDPAPFVPARQGGRGRKPTCLQARVEGQRVDEWAQSQPVESWQRVVVRAGTKGELRVEALGARVWLWDGKESQARLWHLVVTREVSSPTTIKYALSNAAVDTSLEQLVRMQRQRFWVERCFEDGKSESGLGDYQVRGWLAWHHHMALVMMAMLFMLEERLVHQQSHPLLSCGDIEILLANFLPQRATSREEIVRQMTVRHQARQRSIEAAYERQRREDSGASLTTTL